MPAAITLLGSIIESVSNAECCKTWSVCHMLASCLSSCTKWDAIWDGHSCGLTEHFITHGQNLQFKLDLHVADQLTCEAQW